MVRAWCKVFPELWLRPNTSFNLQEVRQRVTAVTRSFPIAWFSAKPSGGTFTRAYRLAGRKCDVNVLRGPKIATSTYFAHPGLSENAMSTYSGHPGMRPQRISDTPAGLAERRIGALGGLGPSFGHFLMNSLVRKEENWCSGRPGALIWSFPY